MPSLKKYITTEILIDDESKTPRNTNDDKRKNMLEGLTESNDEKLQTIKTSLKYKYRQIPILQWFLDSKVEKEFLKFYYPHNGLQFIVTIVSAILVSTFYTVLDGITRDLWFTSVLRGTGQIISFVLVTPLFLSNLSIIKKEQLTLLNSAIYSALLGVVGWLYMLEPEDSFFGLFRGYENAGLIITALIAPSSLRTRWFFLIPYVLLILIVSSCATYFIFPAPWFTWQDFVFFLALVISVILANIISQYYNEKLYRDMFVKLELIKQQELILVEEERRANSLLKNIFPQEIIDRLGKQKLLHNIVHQDSDSNRGYTEQEIYGIVDIPKQLSANQIFCEAICSATCIFTDFKNFTQWSETLSAPAVVSILNQLFLSFDLIIDLYSATKIKTMGDAYQICCGAPTFQDDHAERAIQIAIGLIRIIQTESKKNDWPLRMRIGVHTGPIIHCVLGTKRGSYEVLGPTVALAQFLEAHGEPDTIHCSHSVKKSIRDGHQYQFKPNPIEIPTPNGELTYFCMFDDDRSISTSHSLAIGDKRSQDRDVGSNGEQTALVLMKHPLSSRIWKKTKENAIRAFLVLNPGFANSRTVDNHIYQDLDIKKGQFKSKEMETKFWSFVLQISKRRARFIQFAGFGVLMVFFLNEIVSIHTRAEHSMLYSDWRVISQYPIIVLWALLTIIGSTIMTRRVLLLKITALGFMILGWSLIVITSTLPVYVPSTTMAMFLTVFITYFDVLGVGLRQILMMLSSLLFIVVRLVYWFAFNSPGNLYNLLEPILIALNFTIPMTMASKAMREIFTANEISQRRLEAIEHQKLVSTKLLENVLPLLIIERLKTDNVISIVDNFENTSVIFIEFFGLEESLQERDVVPIMGQINDFIRKVDRVLESNDCEKIKNIGCNTILAVCGCPTPDDEHALKCCRLALDVIDLVFQFNESLAENGIRHIGTRCGINSGPITAGILGTSRFCYDTFGSTVNLASRMASTADLHTAQITEETYEKVKHCTDEFSFERRERVYIKGKGECDVYILGRSDEYSSVPESV